MPPTAAICLLKDLGVLRFHGADAVRFLQGQMSNDITQLAQQPGQLAGYHNPQGRVLALLRLVQPEPDTLLAVLPAALAEPTVQALRRFVLRSKVVISNESGHARITGYVGPWPPLGLPPGVVMLPLPGDPARGLLIDLTGNHHPDAATLSREQWQALDLAAGLPQVYAATTAQFVAQMLNLDCIGGISFNKGCYTGQEVIARAHYRGRVKRRMRRFITAGPATLAPGDSLHLPDGRSAQVVDAVRSADGRCEFLAVTGPAPEQQGTTTTPTAAVPGSAAAAPATEVAVPATTTLNVTELPLPYALPD